MSASELGFQTKDELNKVQNKIFDKELKTKHRHRNSRSRRRWRGGGREKEEQKHESVMTTFQVEELEGSDGSYGPDPQPEQLLAFVTVDEEQVGRVQEEEEEEEEEEQKEETEKEKEKGGFRDSEEDSSSSSSSEIKESQNRRDFRSEELSLPEQRRRPFSVDFSIHGTDDASLTSLTTCIVGGSAKRSFAMSACRKSGTFPSPGAPNYRHNHGSAAHPKGWSSERVPSAVNPGRRYISNSLFVPFGSGKGLPSKWEDAEKWILSPVSGDAVGFRNPVLPKHRRRPKSKSGPLGSSPAGIGSYAMASPFIQTSAANSPLMTGVLVAHHGCCGNGSVGGVMGCGSAKGSRSCSAAHSGHSIVRAASMNGWSELLDSQSLNSSQDADDENDSSTKEDFPVPPVVPMKDVATQMSPDWSSHPSPDQKTNSSPKSLSSPSSTSNNVAEQQSLEYQIRDVQIDDRITITRWSKKHTTKGFDKDLTNIIKWKKKIIDSKTSTWETTGTVQCRTKSDREEAKILAWENLQKAKAETAIRKLEMKLEKKRSSSMDKIFEKLKTAQMKAQEMRGAVATGQSPRGATTDSKAGRHRNSRTNSFGSCFTCHAF